MFDDRRGERLPAPPWLPDTGVVTKDGAMTTKIERPPEGSARRFTVDEYQRMGEAGILDEDERVELLEGEIVWTAPIGSKHSAILYRFLRWFMTRLLDTAIVRVQDPILLDQHSEPEPDLAIVRYREDDYVTKHPEPGDVLLLIEVSESTLAYDRGRKLPLYAAAGIPEVWIADLKRNRLLVYREPRDGRYAYEAVVEHGDAVTPLASPELTLQIDEVLRA
jgi:Uma2 family endonuclease